MSRLLFLLMLLCTGGAFAQFSVSGGTSILKGFGTPKAWYGLNVGLEIPRDDAVSLYMRLSHFFDRKSTESVSGSATAIDVTTSPVFLSLTGVPSMNYTMIGGGTRHYLGDGFDYGFAAYGGTNFTMIFNKVKVDYGDFDQTKYLLDDQSRTGGWIFNLAAGLNGGVKYTVSRLGTFYWDFGFSYLILSGSSVTNISSAQYSNILFETSIGYRYDINW